MMAGLASEGTEQKTIMIDATYPKAHRTASSLRAKKGEADDQRGRLIGRTKDGLNTRLHAVTDAKGRPLKLFMTAGQVSDDTGAAALPDSLPAAEWMLADRDHDADWFRDALQDKGIRPLHPRPEVARQGRPIRQAALSSPKPDRDQVRSPQGLAPRRHTLRQMRNDLPLRRGPRRNCHLLPLTINEAGSQFSFHSQNMTVTALVVLDGGQLVESLEKLKRGTMCMWIIISVKIAWNIRYANALLCGRFSKKGAASATAGSRCSASQFGGENSVCATPYFRPDYPSRSLKKSAARNGFSFAGRVIA